MMSKHIEIAGVPSPPSSNGWPAVHHWTCFGCPAVWLERLGVRSTAGQSGYAEATSAQPSEMAFIVSLSMSGSRFSFNDHFHSLPMTVRAACTRWHVVADWGLFVYASLTLFCHILCFRVIILMLKIYDAPSHPKSVAPNYCSCHLGGWLWMWSRHIALKQSRGAPAPHL